MRHPTARKYNATWETLLETFYREVDPLWHSQAKETVAFFIRYTPNEHNVGSTGMWERRHCCGYKIYRAFGLKRFYCQDNFEHLCHDYFSWRCISCDRFLHKKILTGNICYRCMSHFKEYITRSSAMQKRWGKGGLDGMPFDWLFNYWLLHRVKIVTGQARKRLRSLDELLKS